MKFQVIGAGPAGLCFAMARKRRRPDDEIAISDQNGSSITFGWGVVLSKQAIRHLRNVDAMSADLATREASYWDRIDIIINKSTQSMRGNAFFSISRRTLLKILQERAEDLGVRIVYDRPIEKLSEIDDCDVLVGADGINSTVRRELSPRLETVTDVGSNKYIWLGTTRKFDAFKFIFRENGCRLDMGARLPQRYRRFHVHRGVHKGYVGAPWIIRRRHFRDDPDLRTDFLKPLGWALVTFQSQQRPLRPLAELQSNYLSEVVRGKIRFGRRRRAHRSLFGGIGDEARA